MEELSEIAQGYFQAAPLRVQAHAKETFASMDKDGDKRIDLQEFRSFMRGRGCPDKFIPRLFKVLDRDDSGTLDFSEALTLYYIGESGRPFCDMCDEFIPGTFFSCVDCYNRRESPTYDLCRNCYRSGKCKHNHDGQAQFWDNYTLLLNVKRNMAQRPTTQSPATKAIIVPAVSSKKEKDSWIEDLDDAFNLGMNIATIAAAMCSIQ